MFYTVLFLPDHILEVLPLKEHPRLRIEGLIAGVPFQGACQPNGGAWYLILSKALLKDAGKKLGDECEVTFRIADQDAVNVPEDLQAAIDERANLRRIWNALTPGKRRSFAHRVDSAKRPETREHRILEVIEQILDTA